MGALAVEASNCTRLLHATALQYFASFCWADACLAKKLPYSCRARERSRKGNSYENKTRRKGRPAHKRSPDDTPLRDGNR